MNSKNNLIYIIAGEPSGDFIGSKLINSLKEADSNIKIVGIGGNLMQQAGIKSLFDIKAISIMGIFEILPRIFKILKLVKLTVKDIVEKKPDVLITIDSPGFNFAVVKALKKQLGDQIKLIHYVAPSVWAYKEKRAKKVARLYDYLFCLLPFEPPYFIKEGLKTFFVGHPIVESSIANIILEKEKNINQIDLGSCSSSNKSKKILLLPGSRTREVTTLLPIFLKAASIVKQKYPSLEITIATIPAVANLVKELSKNYTSCITTTENDKYKNFLEAEIALAASGTVTLELALAKVKTVVGYKLNILTSIVLFLLIKIKFVSLINIMANKEIFPEILGPKCTPNKLAKSALKMLQTKLDTKEINNILYQLGYNNFMPSKKASELILQILKGKL